MTFDGSVEEQLPLDVIWALVNQVGGALLREAKSISSSSKAQLGKCLTEQLLLANKLDLNEEAIIWRKEKSGEKSSRNLMNS